MKNRRYSMFAAAGLLLFACSSDDGDDTPIGNVPADTQPPNEGDIGADGADVVAGDAEEQSMTGAADCERGRIEADLMAAPLAGPAIRDGALASGQYLISSTYLRLAQDADSQRLFQELITPVVTDLGSRDGLLALSLGTSASCGSARTLAVWRDEEAMIGFVTGAAHATAMSRVTDVSRGGSVVTHWLGDETSADWADAALQLGADDGPFY
jgi:hypothetical protein